MVSTSQKKLNEFFLFIFESGSHQVGSVRFPILYDQCHV